MEFSRRLTRLNPLGFLDLHDTIYATGFLSGIGAIDAIGFLERYG